MQHEIILFNGMLLESLGALTTNTYQELEEILTPAWLAQNFQERFNGLVIVQVNEQCLRFYLYKNHSLTGLISARRIDS